MKLINRNESQKKAYQESNINEWDKQWIEPHLDNLDFEYWLPQAREKFLKLLKWEKD